MSDLYAVHYWQYGSDYVDTDDVLDYALGMVCAGIDHGTHSTVSVTGPHGILVGERLSDAAYAYETGKLDKWLRENWPDEEVGRAEIVAHQENAVRDRAARMDAAYAQFEYSTGVDLRRFDLTEPGGILALAEAINR